MSFEEYVAARLPALPRYAVLLTGDPHLAEDLVQDVLIRAQGRTRDPLVNSRLVESETCTTWPKRSGGGGPRSQLTRR